MDLIMQLKQRVLKSEFDGANNLVCSEKCKLGSEPQTHIQAYPLLTAFAEILPAPSDIEDALPEVKMNDRHELFWTKFDLF
jgi:hypothetical protein